MGRRAHARVGGGVGHTAGISCSKSPPWLPLLHVLRILRKQLYIAERVVGSIPIMDETTEGAALVVHVVLYICFVSVAIDTLNAWTRGTPEWSAFWGAISPYSMLYTSGKCIARLSASGMSCTVLAMAYVVARVRVCAPEVSNSFRPQSPLFCAPQLPL